MEILGMKGDVDKVWHALRFILEPDDTELVAWGTISLQRDEEWKMFLGIIRKSTTEHLWRGYRDRACNADGAETDLYGRSLFLRLVRMLTRGVQEGRSSVDYMLGALLYENLEAVGRILEQELSDARRRKELKIQVAEFA